MANKIIDNLKKQVLDGKDISRKQAMELYSTADLEALAKAAGEIRKCYCGDDFDLCTILNAKSGGCSEDCKFCAQSKFSVAGVDIYDVIDAKTAVTEAFDNYDKGVYKFSLVTSGRALSDAQLDKVCGIYETIRANREKADNMELCASLGLLTYEQLKKLYSAGVTRYHCNLETSRRFFPQICTTHTYEDKLKTIKSAIKAGMDICSGGIMGLGETADDRLDLAYELKGLGVKSIPINFLNPIKGTPLEANTPLTEDEAKRVIAVYRFILPCAWLRLAGGRGLYSNGGHGIIGAGINSAITGDMLTTPGVSIEKDLKIELS